MKKAIFWIIVILSSFATELAYGECYLNYPYNGQLVTYCVGNSNDNGGNYSYGPVYYNEGVYYNGSYNNGYNNYNYNYNYNNQYNNSYSSNSPYRTDEENYYILLYNNGFEGPGEGKKENYFDVNVIGKDKELTMIDDINIGSFSFKNSVYSTKYSSSVTFITGLKEELKVRYLQDTISYNKIYDSIKAMDNLVYSLNEQYKNLSKYESTGKRFYRDLALGNATDVKSRYAKLKNILKEHN